MRKSRRLNTGFVVLVGVLSALSTVYAGPCPALGFATDCNAVITITDISTTVTTSSQRPYDGGDDTLVGVVNLSSKPISALGLKSALPIFAFDRDGATSFGAAGNAKDTTGYGGPNAYFTNIDATFTSGNVNFITPIAAKTGVGYFSLETALSTAISCPQIINNSVPKPPGGGTNITATFTPQVAGLNLAQAAALCGLKYFNWIQKVVHLPDPSPFYQYNAANPSVPIHLTSASTPFNDPPPNGYTYFKANGWSWNSYPFYWDANSSGLAWSLDHYQPGGNTLTFFDSPKDPCLVGGAAAGTATCNNMTAPAGSYVGFTTRLGGLALNGTPTDLGVGFDWTDNFNGGSAGGISTATYLPSDPTGGQGGVTVTNVYNSTNYQYGGITITTVNGDPAGVMVDLASGLSNPLFAGTAGACPSTWICSGSPDPGFASYAPTSAQYPGGSPFGTAAYSPTVFGGSGVIRQLTPLTWIAGNTYQLDLWLGLPSKEINGTTPVSGWPQTVRLYLTMGDGFGQVAAFDLPSPAPGTFTSYPITFKLPGNSAAIGQNIGVMVFVSAQSNASANFAITPISVSTSSPVQ